MTTLEVLKAEQRGEIYDFPGKYWLDTENVSIAHAKLIAFLDDFADKIYVSALQEALGKVPEATGVNAIPETTEYANGWNDCRKACFEARKETIQGIQSLLPAN